MAATTDYQVQMHIIDQYGNQQDMSPKNTASDVKVGRMSSGSLVLPASGDNEMLITTIQNIRKYLSNLSDVASQVRTVTSDTTDRSNINIPTTAVTSDICDKIDGLDERFQAVTDLANTKSPMSHAATDLTHGGATGSKYGHVKLSDVYATQQANGAAEHSVGASQNALNAAWANLNAEKAPNNHAVAANTYGPATGSAYGHVKTTDVYNSDNADGSMVATQRALYRAWLELTNKNNSQDTAIAGKAPTSHVSGGTEYGIGTTGGFGHLKVWDNMADQVQSDSGRAANAVAASSYAVKGAYDDLKSKVDTKLANTHSGEKATDSAFSHVKLSDAFVTSGGAASSGVGASSKAVCDLNADISTRLTAINSTIEGVDGRVSDLNTAINKVVNVSTGEIKIMGGGTELAPPSNVKITNFDKAVKLTWEDPADLMYEGADLAVWKGTLVIRKAGSPPLNHTDGTVVKDCKIPNEHKFSTLVDSNLTNGTTYYYGIFPYTTRGIYNYTCRIAVIPSTVTLIPPTIKEITAHNGSARLLIVNYTSSGSIKVVYKKDSAPTSIADGSVFAAGSGGSVLIEGLEVGQRYYFAAYAYSGSSVSALSEVKYARVKEYSLLGYKIIKGESNPSARVEYTEDAVGMSPASVNLTTGVFNYGSFRDMWFVKNNRPVMLRSNRTVAYALNPDDYTKKVDGTASDVSNTAFDGNAMSEIPKVYMKTWEDSKYQYCNICNVKLDSSYHEDAYIASDGKPRDVFYMAMFSGSNQSNKMRSLKGLRPSSSTTGEQELTYSGANGAGWSTWSYSQWNLINCLLILMGKTTDIQSAFGYGNYTGGSSAGNLLTTGGASSRGQFTGTSKSNDYMKVFHIENFYADMWKRIRGLCTNASGRVVVKSIPPYNTTGSGYDDPGITPAGGSGGYLSQMLMDSHGLLPVSTANGSQTTYYTDGFWYAANCYALVGGSCADGFLCGPLAVDLGAAFSDTNWCIGAALSCEALATAA